jgi:hypothetical protein
MTKPTYDVSLPDGARALEAWQDDEPQPYRVICSDTRNVDGTTYTTVQATAIQLADGRVDDGSVHEAPHVYLGDNALTSDQARNLAALLVDAADKADGWAGR